MKNLLENILWHFQHGREKMNLLPKLWRIVIFFVGLLFIYLLWNVLFMSGLSQKIEQQQAQKTQAELKIKILDIQYKQLTENIKKIEGIKSQEAILKARLEQLENTSGIFDDKDVSSDKITAFVKVMLTNMGLSLDDLKIMPKEPLLESDFGGLGSSGKKLYKKTIRITFRGKYFGVINYLKELEKLSWQLYWDDLDYKVNQYPEATVELKLHILSI